jgi:hypothetical protein
MIVHVAIAEISQLSVTKTLRASLSRNRWISVDISAAITSTQQVEHLWDILRFI